MGPLLFAGVGAGSNCRGEPVTLNLSVIQAPLVKDLFSRPTCNFARNGSFHRSTPQTQTLSPNTGPPAPRRPPPAGERDGPSCPGGSVCDKDSCPLGFPCAKRQATGCVVRSGLPVWQTSRTIERSGNQRHDREGVLCSPSPLRGEHDKRNPFPRVPRPAAPGRATRGYDP